MERLFSAITNPFNCHINAHWCPQVDTLRVSSISDNLISSITARFIKKEPVVANKFFCEGQRHPRPPIYFSDDQYKER